LKADFEKFKNEVLKQRSKSHKWSMTCQRHFQFRSFNQTL
jgi:hypothetical protein